MNKVITAKDIDGYIAAGRDPLTAIPAGAIVTPAARDRLREAGATLGGSRGPATAKKSTAPALPDYEFHWEPGSDPKTPAEVEAFFRSPQVCEVKERIVDIGRRIWERDYVDGNGGNITVRVGDNLVLCTPTLISKGFMQVEDICLVDMNGNQIAGSRPRTSEVNTHLGIMRRVDAAKSCVHAHPVHATAFAAASVKPPTCIIPEAEVFLGEIGLAPYQTPGTPENSKVVGEMASDHQAIIMENHGVITWGKDVEDAYWKMENTDAYCRVLWIASQLGNGLKTFGPDKLRDLMAIRQKLGMPEKRAELTECELCHNDEFRPGVVCQLPGKDNAASGVGNAREADPKAEAVVREITARILEQLQS